MSFCKGFLNQGNPDLLWMGTASIEKRVGASLVCLSPQLPGDLLIQLGVRGIPGSSSLIRAVIVVWDLEIQLVVDDLGYPFAVAVK